MNFKKYISPNTIALIASVTVCLVTVAIIMGIDITGYLFGLIILGILIQFMISFFVFHYLVDKFIDNRVKLIYKSIYTKKKARVDFLQKHRENGLQSVENEVEKWIAKRDAELEEMKKLEVYRRDFLGNVSHELKTPIFNIQGYISTLLDGAIDDPDVNRSYLERSEASIERMISIVSDLEVISRLENNQIVPEYSNFDSFLLIEEILNDFEIKARECGVTLTLRNKTNTTPLVHADKRQIKQVISNLVQNSIRYRGEHDPYTKITIYNMHEKIFIEVSDNGIGVSEEDIPRLFERFYRTDKARSREKGGSGLGLAIVKHIIEAHNQNITVRSTLGKGTTFSFTLDKSNIEF